MPRNTLSGKVSLLATLFVLALSPLNADVLVSFDPRGLSKGGVDPWNAETDPERVFVHEHIRMLDGLKLGEGFLLGTVGACWGGAAKVARSKAEAIALGVYFTLTIAPTDTQKVSFQSLSIHLQRPAENAPNAYQWQYRLGSGDFQDIGSEGQCAENDSLGNALPPAELANIPELQNVTEPVEFRIVFWNGSPHGRIGIGRRPGAMFLINGETNPR